MIEVPELINVGTEAMAKFPASRAIQKSGMELLGNLAETEEYLRQIQTAKGFEALCNSIQANLMDLEFQDTGMRTIRRLLRHQGAMDNLQDTSLCCAIVYAYAHHSATAPLKNGAEWLFQRLAPETFSVIFTKIGGLEKLVPQMCWDRVVAPGAALTHEIAIDCD